MGHVGSLCLCQRKYYVFTTFPLPGHKKSTFPFLLCISVPTMKLYLDSELLVEMVYAIPRQWSLKTSHSVFHLFFPFNGKLKNPVFQMEQPQSGSNLVISPDENLQEEPCYSSWTPIWRKNNSLLCLGTEFII